MEWLPGVVLVMMMLAGVGLAAVARMAAASEDEDADGPREGAWEGDESMWTSPKYWYIPGNVWYEDEERPLPRFNPPADSAGAERIGVSRSART